jgi:hypothetical protein
MVIPTGLTDQYGEQWGARWKAFLQREHMNAAPNGLLTLIADLRSFLFH